MLDVINEIAKYIKYFLDCLEVCEYFIVNKCNADVVNVLNMAPLSSAIFIIILHSPLDNHLPKIYKGDCFLFLLR